MINNSNNNKNVNADISTSSLHEIALKMSISESLDIDRQLSNLSEDDFWGDWTEHLKDSFNSFIKTQENLDDVIAIKKRFIPPILFSEIKTLVDRVYAGNWEIYFDDVIYFDVFTVEDFIFSRLDNQLIRQKESKINYLSKQNVALKRKLKNEHRKKIWHAQVLLKMVGGDFKEKRPSYISHSLKREYQNNYKNNQQFIKDMAVIGENGDIIPLAQTIRTQEQKAAEILNIIDAMEKKMELNNKENPTNKMDWVFITLTLKPELHPNPTRGRNSYDGTAPNISAKQQKSDWNKVRALLRKKGILPEDHFYGVIVAEVHKDGCQHLHLVFFYFLNNYNKIRSCFFQVFPNLNDNQNDKKCSFKRNNGKAKASSYAFKYVMKATSNFDPNIDIFNLQTEEEKGCLLNSAFRSFNGIRGIQFFGIANCLTKWRFLSRNIKNIELNHRLEEIIRNQDLYSFIAEKHYDTVKNKYYSRPKEKTKKFIGCIVDNVSYLKRFFTKVSLSSLKTNTKDLMYLLNGYIDLSNKQKEEVLVSHNYSRGKEKELFPPGFLLCDIDFN